MKNDFYSSEPVLSSYTGKEIIGRESFYFIYVIHLRVLVEQPHLPSELFLFCIVSEAF